jgi:hypothetical protein
MIQSFADSQRKNPKTNMKVAHEPNENSFSPTKVSTLVTHNSKNEHRNSNSPIASPLSQKRILTERNDLSNSFQKFSPHRKTEKPVSVSANKSRPDSPYPLPYDPIKNYTSPRPEFLRYDPNRRMEIMLRIERAMMDEEEGISPSTSPQFPEEKAIKKEDSLPSNSSISTAPQVQFPVCEEEKCKIDEEEDEEGINYIKMGLKLVFFLLCLISSVYYICSVCSIVDMKIARTSEVSVLGQMIGLSDMCLSRRNVELTCGVEEWTVAMEGSISNKFDLTGFTSEEKDMSSGGESEFDGTDFTPEVEELPSGNELKMMNEIDGIETDIGLLAQGHTVESPEEVGNIQILGRADALKMQVYLLYSMQALACLSVLIALIPYLHKDTSKNLNKKKQSQTSETDAQKDSGIVKKSSNEMSTTIVGNSKMYVIQTSEVNIIGESSFTNATMINRSSVKEVELQAMNDIDASMVKNSLKEVELQATPTITTTPAPEGSLEKIEKVHTVFCFQFSFHLCKEELYILHARVYKIHVRIVVGLKKLPPFH